MDKASILREAIKHITQLQEKVESLEKKVTTTKRCNDVVKSCSSNQSLFSTVSLPLIEARMCHSEVLINIHESERRKGVMEKVVGEIEKQHLSVVSCSFLPFGAAHLNITIIAEVPFFFFFIFIFVSKFLRSGTIIYLLIIKLYNSCRWRKSLS